MNRAVIVLVLCGCAATPTENRPSRDALALGKFNRVVGSWGDEGKRLFIVQTASTAYVSADGQRTVTLVATNHLGTPEYFRSLESALRDAETVWVEGVTLANGGEADLADCPEPLKPLEEWYELSEEVSGLSNQKDWERRVRDDRWKSADADVEQLDAMYTATNPSSWAGFNEALERELTWLRGLSKRGAADDVQREARLRIVDELSHETRKGDEGWAGMNEQRERAAWETIRAGLHTGRTHAILFGAAHCPALEARLIEAGYTMRSATWHDVFSVEAELRER